MGMEKHTWRGAEFQQARRLDWFIATRTPLGEIPLDHTALFKFYNRMETSNTGRKLFEKLTIPFAEACGTSMKKQRTDSFFIHGWPQILFRYGLLKETLRIFLQNLRKQKPGLYECINKELSRDYLGKDFDLTEKDHEKAQHQVKLMAQDLYAVYKAFDSHDPVKHQESFKALVTVFHQQCEGVENKEEKTSCEIVIREKPVGDEIISSPHNTDARYVKKGKQPTCGQKGFLTETCDKDNKTQFITDAEVTPATTPDVKELPGIQKWLEEAGMKPEEPYANAGFVNGQTIGDSHNRGISLEGPSSGLSQSFSSVVKWRPDKSPPIYSMSCIKTVVVIGKPNLGNIQRPGNTPFAYIHPHVDRTHDSFYFTCRFAIEPLFYRRKQVRLCILKVGKRVATLTIDDASYRGASRHHQYMENTDYRKQCATRAGAEATVSERVRSHGVRKSRHRTENRTRLQLLFAAIACNVKRFIRHGLLHGYMTSGIVKMTVVSSFSRIKMAFSTHLFHFLRLECPCLNKDCAILILHRTKLQNISILIN